MPAAAAHIAKAAGVRSLVLDFRRSPEHKFPAQVDDEYNAYHWLLEQRYPPARIGSVGHSIGGYLAIALALRLRDRGEALPGAVLSISPWADPTLSGASIKSNADRDKLLTRDVVELFRSRWLDGTGVDFADPQVNLLRTMVFGLPSTAIYYGEYELLASDALALAARLADAGTDVALRSVEEGQHSFIMGAGRVPEVDRAVGEMGNWLRAHLALTPAQA